MLHKNVVKAFGTCYSPTCLSKQWAIIISSKIPKVVDRLRLVGECGPSTTMGQWSAWSHCQKSVINGH